MIKRVETKNKEIGNYQQFLSQKEDERLKSLFQRLSGKKIVHINSTSEGGGVAQILTGLVPLFNYKGVEADWYKMEADADFFKATKKIHNFFQGQGPSLNSREKELYLKTNQRIADDLKKMDFDLLVVHDPQPLASVSFYKPTPAMLRFHLDSSQYKNSFFDRFIQKYDKKIFSDKRHVIGGGDIFPPAIDPLSDTNKPLSDSKKIISDLGLKTDKPILAQVSRFDKFKDPLGVVDIYKKVKKEVSGSQLILFGIGGAEDDPEAESVFKEVKKKVDGDRDVRLFFYPDSISHLEANEKEIVNAIQREADVVFQNSYREAFGLTVTEAMWKGQPVVGSTGVGIKKQITNEVDGFITKDYDQAVERAIKLIKNPNLKKEMGRKAKEKVKDNYLLTRLVEDHLQLYVDLLNL